MIIGIAEYASPRLRLQTPVHDAEALARILADRHGYEILLRCDGEATREHLEHLFDTELPALVDESRRVLVYFAGHGVATNSLEDPVGYLVPADGCNAIESLFPMARLGRALDVLRCRHLLLILDCCFAGAFRWSIGRDVILPHLPEMYRERYELFLATPAWQVITSAAYDERAADLIAGMVIGQRPHDLTQLHSPFFLALRDGLEGDADLSPRADEPCGDGIITATELYLYLRERLEPADEAMRQTPGLWWLPKHRKGEYIFHVPGRAPRLAEAGPLSRETSPYRGFEAYDTEHAPFFHGRSAAIAALLARVEQQPITVIVGNSGTGKSSLVRAGLIPVWHRHHPGWQILGPIRPGPAPLAALEAAVAMKHDGASILVIDQLEELFAAPEGEAARRQFLERLVTLAEAGDMRIVGTLRADLETELWASPLGGTWQQIRFPLADMTREELREAIERPAEQMVLTFDPPEMVDRLIDTVVSMPGALPLLSFTLDKLYFDCVERATGDRRLVEIDRLDAGGIALALRNHVDALHEGLDPASRTTMRGLLLRMVSIKGGSAVRRQVPLGELDFADPEENRRVRVVLDLLTGAPGPVEAANGRLPSPGLRIAVLGGDQDLARFVELAHDAVAHDWPRLKAWLAMAQEDLLLHRAVTAASDAWIRAEEHPGTLWHDDPRLALARTRLAPDHSSCRLNRVESQFIQRSRRARVARRSGLTGIASGVGLLLYLLYSGLQSERAANERAEEVALTEQGTRAGAQAHVPGQEEAALVVAIDALHRAMHRSRPVPATVLSGAVEAAIYRRIALPGQPENILSLACSPDGTRVVASGADGSIFIGSSDGSEGARVTRQRAVRASVFTTDGSAIITGDDRGSVRRWSAVTPAISSPVGEHGAAIQAVAISPDGQRVATAGDDGRVKLWSIADSKAPAVDLAGFNDLVTDVVFSRDGTRIAASSRDGTSRVWAVPAVPERSSGSEPPLFVTTPEAVSEFIVSITSIDLSEDGARLVTGGARTTVWDITSRRRLFSRNDASVLFSKFSFDGKDLVTGHRDGSVVRWDSTSFRKIGVAIRHTRSLSVMSQCGSGHRWIVTDDTGRAYIRDLSQDNAVTILGSRGCPVNAVRFDRQDRTVIADLRTCRGAPARQERWDVRSRRIGKPVPDDDPPGTEPQAASSEDIDARQIVASVLKWKEKSLPGLFLETAIDGRHVGLIGRADGRQRTASRDSGAGGSLEEAALDALTPDGASSSIAVSPAGDRWVITSLDGTFEVFDVAARRTNQRFGHTGAVRAAVFSPDGTTIATTGDDGTARLWDVETGATLAVFTGHEGPVLSSSFSHDGALLATAGADGTIRIYPVRPAGILALACSRLRGTAAWSRVTAQCPRE